MAREAVPVELYNGGRQRRLTVADANAITKGTLLSLQDPRTASGSLGTSVAGAFPCAGVASMDKEASDGSTSITVWTDGIFEMYASGAITRGNPIVFTTGNYVNAVGSTATASGAIIAGYAMETASDGEVINVRINL